MRRRAGTLIALALLVVAGSALPGSAKTNQIEFEININRNTKTGTGTLWRTCELTLEGCTGGYSGTWVASFTGKASPEWTGHGVGKGFGDREGDQVRIDLTQQPYGDSVTGVLFMPGNE